MPSDPISEQLKLDHFKVYKQYAPNMANTSVSLQGQFDKAQVPAKLGQMDYFANPVSKSGSKLLDKQAHLAFYQLLQRSAKRRVVIIRNQFGLQKLLLGRPMYLLAPSQKIEKDSAAPKGLSHFKAYQVLAGEDVPQKVSLADQFGQEKTVEVDRPEFFCVPVSKLHSKKTTRLVNPKAHLTFYAISPKAYKLGKLSNDQFGKHELLIGPSVMLGVPTMKLDWAEA